MTLKIFSPKAFHFNLFPCFVTVSNSVLNSYFGLAAPFPTLPLLPCQFYLTSSQWFTGENSVKTRALFYYSQWISHNTIWLVEKFLMIWKPLKTSSRWLRRFRKSLTNNSHYINSLEPNRYNYLKQKVLSIKLCCFTCRSKANYGPGQGILIVKDWSWILTNGPEINTLHRCEGIRLRKVSELTK